MGKNKKTAKTLLVLWWVFYIICNITLSVAHYNLSKTSSDPLRPLGELWFAVFGLVVFIMLPWMFAIYRIAKKENNKNIKLASLIVIIIMVCFTVMMIIISILAAFGVKLGRIS